MRRIDWRQPMSVWPRRGGSGFWMGASRAEGMMNRHERADEHRRHAEGRGDSHRTAGRRSDGLDQAATRRESASGLDAPGKRARSADGSDLEGGARDGRENPAREAPAHNRHDQLVFVTSFGIPIGPSVQEELRIPDDLDDTLPPGDLPGQLLLDLGLA